MRGVSDEALTLEETRRLLQPFPDVRTFIVAVSGGPDSTALMGLVAEARAVDRKPDVIAATVDHGLRAESASEAAAVKALAQSFGLDHVTLAWPGPKPTTGLQEAARSARYELLFRLARECNAGGVLLAHTLDDQAETVLMRLFRGSGLAGLGGMDVRSERDGLILARPLLGTPKSRLVATCAARGWRYATDPTNEDAKFLRPRLRRMMPALAAEGLTAERLATLARRAAGAEAALRRAAAAALEAGERDAIEQGAKPGSVTGVVFVEAPFETAARMVGHLLRQTVAQAHVRLDLERLEALTRRLRDAIHETRDFHATLHGGKISYVKGYVTAYPAPPRRFS